LQIIAGYPALKCISSLIKLGKTARQGISAGRQRAKGSFIAAAGYFLDSDIGGLEISHDDFYLPE
jgi:hypothetical protein